MPHVSPGTSDATELAELLHFPSGWPASDHTALGPALTRFTGHTLATTSPSCATTWTASPSRSAATTANHSSSPASNNPTSHGPGPKFVPTSGAKTLDDTQLVLPSSGQRPGIKHHLQLSQLRLIQLAARSRPPGCQPGQATSLPGPAPPPHRPLADPQLSCDHRRWQTLPEALHGLQPDLFPASSALRG